MPRPLPSKTSAVRYNVRMLIYLPDQKEIHPDAVALLRENGHKVLSGALKDGQKPAVEALFIRTYTRADRTYLAGFPSLRFVLRAGAGLDNIDLGECRRRGIKVLSAPGANANAVAEFAVMLTVMLLRNFRRQEALLRSGKWRSRELMGSELAGKVVGLVGCGAIGRLFAAKLAPFGVRDVLGYDPYLDSQFLKKHGIDKTDLKSLLADADIVSLHVPLAPETQNLIGERELALLKPSAVLINTARGGIVNEPSLLRALGRRRIRGCALDVFEHEPAIRREFLELDNVVATPHIAGYTGEADREMSLAPARELLRLI